MTMVNSGLKGLKHLPPLHGSDVPSASNNTKLLIFTAQGSGFYVTKNYDSFHVDTSLHKALV